MLLNLVMMGPNLPYFRFCIACGTSGTYMKGIVRPKTVNISRKGRCSKKNKGVKKNPKKNNSTHFDHIKDLGTKTKNSKDQRFK